MTMLGRLPTAARALDRESSRRTSAEAGLGDSDDHRTVLHSSPLVLVENCAASADAPPISGYDSRYQLLLPYLGLFGYCVGRRTWLVDPNQILFVTPGREFTDTHPVSGLGHAGLVVNPSAETLDELCGGGPPSAHPAFTIGTRNVSTDVRLMTHYLLNLECFDHDPLGADEVATWLMISALGARQNRQSEASRTIRMAKEMLHEQGRDRLTLNEMAAEIGVSGPYLTQAFARSEGIPLYRYQTQLRLSRALVQLPECDSITNLALDLGFYCHSHFSYVFRRYFGMTPSEYRNVETPRSKVRMLAAGERPAQKAGRGGRRGTAGSGPSSAGMTLEARKP